MSDRTGDFVFVNGDDRLWASTFDTAEDAAAKMGLHRRAWWGEVFFDHLRGVIDPAPSPGVDGKPYLLVTFHRDFEWTSQHSTNVREYDDPAALLADAKRMVAEEKRGGSSNYELWEVYGVRVCERRPRPRMIHRGEGVTDELLEAIRAAPDDDGPRLVWADAVGGERGELVVIQTQLARGEGDGLKLRRRQKELLARHGAAWSGLEGLAQRVTFHRGFVDAAEMPASTFLEQADAILEAAPLLSSLTVRDLARDRLPELFVDPATRELRGLDMHTSRGFAYEPQTHGDATIEALIGAGLLRGLRALGLDDAGAGVTGVRMLLGMRALHELERLALRDYLQGDAIVALLNQGGLTSLRALELGAHCDLREVAPRLPSSLVELTCARLDLVGLEALASSPVATRIERLVVLNNAIGRLDALAKFTRLRSLALLRTLPSIIFKLDDVELPALRELAIEAGHPEPYATFANVARRYGPQLELLDMRGSAPALRHLNSLKPHVRGELLVGQVPAPPDLLRVAPTLHAQWWDHVRLG
jgi:uncharacterized protein (TIGR02996 family)